MNESSRSKLRDYIRGLMEVSPVVGIPVGAVLISESEREECVQIFTSSRFRVVSITSQDTVDALKMKLLSAFHTGTVLVLDIQEIIPELMTWMRQAVDEGRALHATQSGVSTVTIKPSTKLICLLTEEQYQLLGAPDLVSSVCRLN